MQEDRVKSLFKKPAVRSAMIFVISYALFLVLWIGIKDNYSRALTGVATYFITAVKDVDLHETTVKKDVITVSFIPKRHRANVIIDIDVVASSYTFNAPLSFAIMAAFYPFLKKKRVYIEVLSILLIVHILYVFSSEGEKLTGLMVDRGYEETGKLKTAFWQFFWGFVDNMMIRFEPFLLGAYLYFRRDK